MRLKHIWVFLIAMMLFLSFGAFAAGEEENAGAENEAVTVEDAWTVLIYMCGSDLESRFSYATGNLEEIAGIRRPRKILDKEVYEAAGQQIVEPRAVNVLIATGGTKEWHTQELGMEIQTDCLQYWRYEPAGEAGSRGTFLQLETRPLASMADPETLTDFIRWGASNYPAEKYCLAMWDHGGGSKTGIFIDELFGDDFMYLDELKKALVDGGVRFETVLFDACLMANLETAVAIMNQANWMVASEEVVAGKGTAIGDWLQQLYYLPDCDGERLGRWICDMTAIKFANEDDEQARELMTWSVIDMSRIDEMAAQCEYFFKMMGAAYERTPQILASFARAVFGTDFYGSGNDNMYDLAAVLYEREFNETSDPETHWKFMDTVTKAIAYNLHGSGRASARGLSFCYGTDFSLTELETYSRNCPSPHYLALLDAISPWTAPDWVFEQAERLPEIGTLDAYQVKINKFVYADGTPAFTIEDGYDMNVGLVRYNLYRRNEETGQTESLGTAGAFLDRSEGKNAYRIYDLEYWPSIDGTLCQIDLLTKVLNENYDSLINIPIRINGQVWNLRCGFSGKNMHYDVYGLWEGFDSQGKMFNRNVKSLAQFAGQEFRLLYEQNRDPETGRISYAASEPQRMTRGLIVQEVKLPAGTYEIEFVIDDVFNRSMKLDRVEMEWDGEQMKIRTDGWEGSETLDIGKYY